MRPPFELSQQDEQWTPLQIRRAADALLVRFDALFPKAAPTLSGVALAAKSMKRVDRYELIMRVARAGYRRAIIRITHVRSCGFYPYIDRGYALRAIEHVGLKNADSTLRLDLMQLARARKVKTRPGKFALMAPPDLDLAARIAGGHQARAFNDRVDAVRARYQASARRVERRVKNDVVVRVHFMDLERMLDRMDGERLAEPPPRPLRGLRLVPDGKDTT